MQTSIRGRGNGDTRQNRVEKRKKFPGKKSSLRKRYLSEKNFLRKNLTDGLQKGSWKEELSETEKKGARVPEKGRGAFSQRQADAIRVLMSPGEKKRPLFFRKRASGEKKEKMAFGLKKREAGTHRDLRRKSVQP